MTDPLNGLRFDIYERVHLPDHAAAIEELEEIELVPSIQALPQEDHVTMRGHLILSGIYRPQNAQDGEWERLEHRIPVEITLPQSRVESASDLTVEIDNFDVDLLSTRSLNVTGVLALRGLQAESAQVPVWRDDSFTVVHQARDAEAPEQEEAEAAAEAQVRAEAEAEAEAETDAEAVAESKAEPDVPAWQRPAPAFEAANPWPSGVGWGDLSERQQPADEAEPPSLEADESPAPASEADQALPAAVVAEEAPEPKPAMKVAVGGKPLDAASEPIGVGLLSQLGEKAVYREAELAALRSELAKAEEALAKSPRETTGDELDLTRLFLNAGADAQPFRKIRMCIVQREDTIDSLAARYNVQPRELQLRNRLSDALLSEGQVLYIP